MPRSRMMITGSIIFYGPLIHRQNVALIRRTQLVRLQQGPLFLTGVPMIHNFEYYWGFHRVLYEFGFFRSKYFSSTLSANKLQNWRLFKRYLP